MTGAADGAPSATVHASCVNLGGRGVLIRGRPGAGKTTLALLLIDDFRLRGHAAALVADDRVAFAAAAGGIVASAPPALAGLVEVRGRGVEPEPFVASAGIVLVVDIVPAASLPRLPEAADALASVGGATLPRQAVPEGDFPRALLLVRRALGVR